MIPLRMEEMKKWIIKRGRPWTILIEDDKIRIMTNSFIIDMRIVRDLEMELKFVVDDIMSHAKYGIVLLTHDPEKGDV